MATTKEYRNYVLDTINMDGVTYKPMMGEYLLYYNNVLFGGIYDDRLLVKIVENNKKYNMEKTIPYESAKEMYLVDIDSNNLKDIITDTYEGLKS